MFTIIFALFHSIRQGLWNRAALRRDPGSPACLQARSKNGFVPVPILSGYRRGFGTVRPARMEFLVPRFIPGFKVRRSSFLWARHRKSFALSVILIRDCVYGDLQLSGASGVL